MTHTHKRTNAPFTTREYNLAVQAAHVLDFDVAGLLFVLVGVVHLDETLYTLRLACTLATEAETQ